MKCPVCHVDLAMAERQSVEISYCPQCRGVWLDPGKLDKIIDRCLSNAPVTSASARPDHCHEPHHGYQGDHHGKHYDKEHYKHGHYDKHHDSEHDRHRPKSFFEKLFD